MELQGMRDLHAGIFDFEGEGIYEFLLKKWIIDNQYKEYLSEITSRMDTDRIEDLSLEDIWELYALSRVLDLLTLRFQPDNNADGSSWAGPDLTVEEYIGFIELLGLEVVIPQSFRAFDCEILEAIAGEPDFALKECCFPAVKFKNILIKRAGVKISLNPENNNLALVNNAKMYWTYRRKNRKHSDTSKGWGSNSQWRTDFRLDLETPESFIYNVSGKYNLSTPNPEVMEELRKDELNIDEAREITKFRHFIQSTSDDSDLYVEDFRYDEKKAE